MGGKRATEWLQADAAGVERASELLRAGGLVALPTETVYGLAARADDADAVAGIYRAKGRPDFNPLIVHVADTGSGERLARFDDRARKLADRFWPGPLTMVLPLRENAGIAPAVTAGLATIALRVPGHPVMQAVLRRSGLALAAPSANRSGLISPTAPQHVAATLDGRIAAIMNGGPCASGIESTILALRNKGWSLLRPGPISAESLTDVLGSDMVEASEGIEAPGQMTSHYAPGKPLRLNAQAAGENEFLIGFGEIPGDCSLSATGDMAEAAARLYECLHVAAAAAQPSIAVAPIPFSGVGAAINDRLRRAAA
ncbi:threonylcarbamoyl-AMP synthase [Altererythrobacter sp. SALINAS58]|uniref:L-threonylcarbamoyladenylate synthase n=1 Tax=Alteripontixanthobacter muriae TaxID=2705546 RepID=UPI0015771E39|nr:L-threonylcarbamoyladenylate synthase [Alteripontixanthobacter muriae]NTZ43513.1 threonylcarbamoyl-AMP synthase [Alteripontixanthobacter muriae]